MIDFQHSPDDVGIAAEVALPEAVVENNHGMAAVLRIGWLDVAAEKRAHTKESPCILCEVGARDLFRKGAAGDLNVPVGLKPSTDSTGAARRRSSNCALLSGNKAKRVRMFFVEAEEVHDAVGVGVRKRVQQDGIDEREHRRGGADAERE